MFLISQSPDRSNPPESTSANRSPSPARRTARKARPAPGKWPAFPASNPTEHSSSRHPPPPRRMALQQLRNQRHRPPPPPPLFRAGSRAARWWKTRMPWWMTSRPSWSTRSTSTRDASSPKRRKRYSSRHTFSAAGTQHKTRTRRPSQSRRIPSFPSFRTNHVHRATTTLLPCMGGPWPEAATPRLDAHPQRTATRRSLQSLDPDAPVLCLRGGRPQRSRSHRVGRRHEHEGVGLFLRPPMS